MKRLTGYLLCAAMLLCGVLSGCSAPESGRSRDLMDGVTPRTLSGEAVVIDGENAVAPTDFAIRLLQASCQANESVLISPISVLYALAMTANGAQGETRQQMETVLGLPVPELNAYLKAYMDALGENDAYKLRIANSIWFTEDEHFTAEPDFLQANADYYSAGIYQSPFDDSTLKDINDWVDTHTDGMIDRILEEIPPDAVMYLINAVAFDARWQEVYQDTQVRDGVFTTEDGQTRDVELMHSEESLYLDDDNATGFLKYYADSRYAFVALLPKEGMGVAEYAASLTGEGIAALLANPQEATVFAAIPKFEQEYSTELGGILANMGMADAFDPDAADFSGLGTSTAGNLFLSRVLHKTYLAVDEQGTRAGAATAVEVSDAAAMPQEPKEVILDRPFLYLLIDCEANLPLFMGTMLDVDPSGK